MTLDHSISIRKAQHLFENSNVYSPNYQLPLNAVTPFTEGDLYDNPNVICS